jgi:stringent starvation protein B
MKSTKPYLIRAIHEWCADQGFTPYLAVKVDATTRVPREFVKDGEIVLNVGVEATHQLMMGNEEISFQARFGGKAFPVVVPIERVAAMPARTAIYARDRTAKPASGHG